MSGARKFKKWLNIVPVGGPESVYIAASEVSCPDNIRAAPGEDRSSLLLNQHIRHQSSMTPIAVGERMNEDETMMKPDCDFVRLESLVIKPVANISKQCRQRIPDLIVRDSDILFRGPVRSSPLPGLVEHP